MNKNTWKSLLRLTLAAVVAMGLLSACQPKKEEPLEVAGERSSLDDFLNKKGNPDKARNPANTPGRNFIIAKVDDDIITHGELKKSLMYLEIRMREEVLNGEMTKKEAAMKLRETSGEILKYLIENSLLVKEAKRLKIEVTREEAKEKLEKFAESVGGYQRLQRLLMEQGMTIYEYRNKIKEDIMRKRLIDENTRMLFPGIPGPEEIKTMYTKLELGKSKEEKRYVCMFSIKKDTTKKIKQIRALFQQGTAFTDIAVKFGKDIKKPADAQRGWVKPGDFALKLEKVIFAAKKGDMDTIEISDLTYIIYVKDIKSTAKTPLNFDMTVQLINRISRKRKKIATDRLVKELTAKAYIKKFITPEDIKLEKKGSSLLHPADQAPAK